MSFTDETQKKVRDLLQDKVESKLRNYSPETISMPFHDLLLGKRRRAIFSFVHSLNTSLGQSVFEEVAETIAVERFKVAKRQYRELKGYLSEGAIAEINRMMDDLANDRVQPNKPDETRRIVLKATEGVLSEERNPRVDLFLLDENEVEYFIDIKTAKPNISAFRDMKRELLQWVAIRASLAKNAEVRTLIAIPYNPYDPEPYERWTGQGLFDYKNELLVGKVFWDFLGGDGAYEQLLGIFAEVGQTVEAKLRAIIESI